MNIYNFRTSKTSVKACLMAHRPTKDRIQLATKKKRAVFSTCLTGRQVWEMNSYSKALCRETKADVGAQETQFCTGYIYTLTSMLDPLASVYHFIHKPRYLQAGLQVSSDQPPELVLAPTEPAQVHHEHSHPFLCAVYLHAFLSSLSDWESETEEGTVKVSGPVYNAPSTRGSLVGLPAVRVIKSLTTLYYS